MITASSTDFPENAVEQIYTSAKLIDSGLEVFRRPLRDTDPTQSIGVFGVSWLPVNDSFEMRGGYTGPSEPTLQRYTISVQAFVKDMDEQRGLVTHSVLAKLVRAMLYRDPVLRVGLSALVTTTGGSTERITRWGVSTQRFLANELQGSWLYLSTLDFWIETESV